MHGDPSIAETLVDALTRPAAIRRLHLQFEDAPVVALDGRIAWLASLEELHIGSNRSDIARVDGMEVLLHLRGLRRLGLSLAGLPELPPAVHQLTSLEHLTIDACELRRLDGLGHLLSLTRLELSLRRLESLPPTIGRLKRLSFLSLRGCQLTRLPDEIGELSSLVDLFAEDNRLASLPASLERLPAIERMLFGGNLLRSVPEGLAELPLLRDLDLTRNDELRTVPVALAARRDLTLRIEPEKIPATARADVVQASKEAFAELDTRAKARERIASLFVVAPGEGGPTDSKVGGTPWLAANETWPRCGLCEVPLSFFLQIDYGAYPGHREHTLLQLFSCEERPSIRRLHALAMAGDARLDPHYVSELRDVFAKLRLEEVERLAFDRRSGNPWTPAHYQFVESRGLRRDVGFVLEYGCHALTTQRNSVTRRVRVVDALPGVFPYSAHAQRSSAPPGPPPRRIVRLDQKVDRPTSHDLGEDAWELVRALVPEQAAVPDTWTISSDKLGGWPRWLQDQEWQPCPVCRKPTSELALTLEGAEDDLFPDAFPSQILYVTRCAEHPRALVWSVQGG